MNSNANKIIESVLISIRPEWVAKILSGEKTVEVRKTYPTKIETPFKCYIYCTKNASKYHYNDEYGNVKFEMIPQKVVGEFVCDKIDTYISEFYIPAKSNVKYIGEVYEDICKIHINDDGEKEFLVETSNECPSPNDCAFCKNTCLSFDEIKNYIGNGFTYFYAWHISNLKIYDKPKELGKFKTRCPQAQYSEIFDVWYCKDGYTKTAIVDSTREFPYNEECIYFDNPKVGESERVEYAYCMCNGYKEVIRPPQSWSYVKKLGDYDNE